MGLLIFKTEENESLSTLKKLLLWFPAGARGRDSDLGSSRAGSPGPRAVASVSAP